ncbi:hypothetical protein CLOACE_04240 [Clostridium acetireducens DSM 10703]|uniref:DUF4321 domain-containing protein n=1 Tax=Clostridium acetireducens DSM 10703 TaxID=1121290 RepID=A0A1E8F180_9CLOT|nr:DUF4321 domain-containing protein [Clostridium acetireducens]OFI07233.1 hypothetical protein CLOACE_04240 [Clostridium acetireducens DSM 10703]
MRGVEKGNKSLLWFMIFLGAIGGSLIGDILGENIRSLAFLKTPYYIGMSNPIILDLKVILLTIGLKFNINIMTIVGIVLSIILTKKH